MGKFYSSKHQSKVTYGSIFWVGLRVSLRMVIWGIFVWGNALGGCGAHFIEQQEHRIKIVGRDWGICVYIFYIAALMLKLSIMLWKSLTFLAIICFHLFSLLALRRYLLFILSCSEESCTPDPKRWYCWNALELPPRVGRGKKSVFQSQRPMRVKALLWFIRP